MSVLFDKALAQLLDEWEAHAAPGGQITGVWIEEAGAIAPDLWERIRRINAIVGAVSGCRSPTELMGYLVPEPVEVTIEEANRHMNALLVDAGVRVERRTRRPYRVNRALKRIKGRENW